MIAASSPEPARPDRIGSRHSPAVLFAGWTACYFLYLCVDITHGIKFSDEAWFLQVVHRVQSGDALYRDIFFGATPLSVALALLFTKISGAEILAIKCLMGAIYLATAMVSASLLKQICPFRGHPFLLATAIMTIAPPWRLTTPYSGLAELFLLCCFGLSIVRMQGIDRDSDSDGTTAGRLILLALGGAAACAFMSKQNIGVCALIAICAGEVAIWWDVKYTWRKVSHALIVIVASFSIASFLMSLPILLDGGWQQFLDYGFTNKSAYLLRARVGYWSGFSELLHADFSLKNLPDLVNNFLLHALPLVTLGGLMFSLTARPGNIRMTILVLIYFVATVIGVFPRFDAPHLAYIAPGLLVGFLYSWRHLRFSLPEGFARFLERSMVFFIAGIMCLLLAKSARLALSTNYHLSELPHFRGVLLKQSVREQLQQVATAMAEDAAKGKRLFLLSPRAGFFYLFSGVRNPTPFDYPLATAMGRHGEEQLIEAIGKGLIDRVWVDERIMEMGPLSPEKLLAYISANLQPCDRVRNFTVYQLADNSIPGE